MKGKFFYSNKYFWTLIVFMGIVSGVLFFDFIINKRLFVFYDIGGDTRQSYWPMYHYLIESIREGTLKSWSFQLGLGTSTFTLYSFLFDPFILLLMLFPIKLLPYGLLVSAIAKIFISGALFYWYLSLLYIRKYPAVIASLIWACSGYMILWGQHYWFATMIVLFTFVMLALEMWLRGKKTYFFPISIAIMGLNSPYFLFMISLFIFFYVVFHYIFTEKSLQIKMLFFRLIRFFRDYFIGLGASAIVFLPVSYLIVSSPRTSGSFFSEDIFKSGTYLDFISIFLRIFSNNTLGVGLDYFGTLNYYEGPMLSTSLLFILALPQLLFVKAKLKNKIGYLSAIGVCITLLLFPFFSKFFSAFSSITYRWNFFLVFLIVLTIGHFLQYYSKQRKIYYLGLIISAIIVIIGWDYSYKILLFQNVIPTPFLEVRYLQKIAIMVAWFLVIYSISFLVLRKKQTALWILLLCTVAVELIMFNYPTINQRYTVPVDVEKKKEGYYDYTNEAVSYIKSQDKEFYRIDKNYESYSLNDSLIQNYYGVKSYNSLNQPSYINLLTELDTGVDFINLGIGFDDRSALRDLTGVKYILAKDEHVPSEYKKLKTFGDVNVYKNPNVLPIGFTYDAYMKEKEFKKLMPFEKDDVFLHAAVIEGSSTLQEYIQTESNNKSVNIDSVEMLNSEIKKIRNNHDFEITTLSNDPGMIIRLPQNSPTWRIEFEIQGPGNTNGQLFLTSNSGTFNPEAAYNFDVSKTSKKVAYEINDKNLSEIRFDPGTVPGKYIIKNFNITLVEVENRHEVEQVAFTDKVQIQQFTNSYIKGKLNVDKSKLMFFSIPYDHGWTVKIDGKKVDTELINLGFIGAYVPQGNHLVELEYHPPLLKIGFILSILCFGIIIRRIFTSRNKKRVYVTE